MNKYYKNDIHERIYKFVIRVINLTKTLAKTPQNEVIIHQIVKSATSMGANDQEADGAESKKDFIAKYTIVKKENKETNYWLRVIEDTNPEEMVKRYEDIRKEGLEILRIVSAIIINTKRKI
jgi:four helix bundle protein